MEIKILSPQVAARIAAGEVVERPASVVKELLENALDAGADTIRIETSAGGMESISVFDNGHGVPPREIPLIFTRFATSKVESESDLESISSLGFRGEAMYSIASVSEVELETSLSGSSVGSRIIIKNGDIVEQTDSPPIRGTRVKVLKLFGNFPARKKFLKSNVAESGRIHRLVQRYAMIRPDVSFELRQGQARPFATHGKSNFREVLSAVYGRKVSTEFLSINPFDSDFSDEGLSVTGIISTPAETRANRSHINVFVNGRWVEDKTIAFAFIQSYHGFIQRGKFPIGLLDIRIPESDVDVNVHPAKTEVRFKNENQVFALVQKNVRQTLVQYAPVPNVSAPTPTTINKSSDPSFFWPNSSRSLSGHRFTSELSSFSPYQQETELRNLSLHEQFNTSTFHETLPLLRILGQVMNTYIVAEGPSGVYILDQHAAHERVVFEDVVEKIRKDEAPKQILLEPVVIDLEGTQVEILNNNQDLFSSLGMDIEEFGQNTYLIRSIPSVLSQSDPKSAFIEAIDILASGTNFESWEEKAAYSIACHAAIRAGKALTLKEMESLVGQLESCRQPNTCPHGRPTLIQISESYLERQFGRT